MMRNWFSLVLFALALVVGCGKNPEATKPENPAPLPKAGPKGTTMTTGGPAGLKPPPPPPAPEPP